MLKQGGFINRGAACLLIPIQEYQMHSPSPFPADGDVNQRTYRPVRQAF
jgi:hypothetical protein